MLPQLDEPLFQIQTAGDRQANTEELRSDLVDGLLYIHMRLADNNKRALDAASFIYSLIELLSEKGLISIEEIDVHKKIVSERLMKQNRERGMGVLLQDAETDKYTTSELAEIDCENRIDLCHAACCKLPFALSKQDIQEGIVRWDLGQPYIIAQGPDGYCTHLERGVCQCTVRQNRPLPCRAYDCSKGNTIWLDFDKRIINPEILQPHWPRGSSDSQGGPVGQ